MTNDDEKIQKLSLLHQIIITNMKSSGYPSRSGHIDTQQIRIPNISGYPTDQDTQQIWISHQIWISNRSGYPSDAYQGILIC